MKIKELREARGKTQAQLADAMGVSRVAVYYWEAGRQMPSADKLPLLARFLGCSIDALFGMEPSGPRQAQTSA